MSRGFTGSLDTEHTHRGTAGHMLADDQHFREDSRAGTYRSLKEPLDLAGVGSVLGLLLNALSLLLEQVDDCFLSIPHSTTQKKDEWEYGHTGRANDLALLLGLKDTGKATQEQVRGIHNRQVDAQVLAQRRLDLLALVEAHQAVVDQHGVEPVTNRLLHELGRHRAVDTARHGTNDLRAVTHKVADARDLLLDKVAHDPAGAGAADVDAKVAQQLAAAGRVLELRVELDTKDGLALVGNTSKLGVGGAGDDDKALGERHQLVKVGHVGMHGLAEAGEQAVDVVVNLVDGHIGVAVLASLAASDVG